MDYIPDKNIIDRPKQVKNTKEMWFNCANIFEMKYIHNMFQSVLR